MHRTLRVCGHVCVAILTCCLAVAQAQPEPIPLGDLLEPLPEIEGGEPLGAEDASAEDDRPRIPEPMVFDLVRPLGAKRGEVEFNTLALIPARRVRIAGHGLPDELGVLPDHTRRTEWAPEIEMALWDGFAVEFELPFEEGHLAAYKTAVQLTLGTAFDNKYIHGIQAIAQYDVDPEVGLLTFLYIGGLRLDETWSILFMGGFRAEIGGGNLTESTERLFNFNLFADVCDHLTVGVESDYAVAMGGDSSLLLMPQLHWEVHDNAMLQSGAGVRFADGVTVPEIGVRAIISR
jgi:hypothetical protein